MTNFHPWRRFFARMIDLGTYLVPTLLFYHLILHRNPLRYPGSHTIVFFLVYLLFSITLESLFLWRRGQTTGHSLFGITILSPDGGKLSFIQALKRTFSLYIFGLALGIFPLSVIAMLLSYLKYRKGQRLAFDNNIKIEISTKEPIFSLIFISFLRFVLIFYLLTVSHGYTSVPNHGLLTPAQLSENYHALQKYFYLEDKTWDLSDDLIFYSDKISDSIQPTDFKLITDTENGKIIEIHCSFSGTDSQFTMPHKEILLLLAASNGADGFDMKHFWAEACRRFDSPVKSSRYINTFDDHFSEMHYSFIADGYTHKIKNGQNIYSGGSEYSLNFDIYIGNRR
ncbi:MAG: RDD family protein [Clostridia bacterium]|nr:RDD family protein [Clostridia bacterium]